MTRKIKRRMRTRAQSDEMSKDMLIERLQKVVEAQRRMLTEYERTIQTLRDYERIATQEPFE